ncbi:MAG: hypothetical protein ACJ8M4_08720 [Chthoniobacterales bacterium]
MRSREIRSFVVVLSLAAWFALSNHCVLAVVTAAKSVSERDDCPMHSAPAKKMPAAKAPCCKEVRAIVAKSVTATPGLFRMIASPDYAAEIFGEAIRVAAVIEVLDTGPPGCVSFAESVLQESMLSHAPPVS